MMDDLDKQLAELQLINNAELPPNPAGVKKQGPAVPPKPKKQQQQPLVSVWVFCLFLAQLFVENGLVPVAVASESLLMSSI